MKRSGTFVMLVSLLHTDRVAMAGGILVHRLAVAIKAGERARQGNRHGSPDGEQHGKSHQEPDAKELHESKASRRTTISKPRH